MYVVRADQHECHIAQLRDARHVPAVSRRAVRRHSMPSARGVRPRHLRLLRRRNARQNHGDGARRSADVPGRHLEPARLLHRRRRVTMI